MQPHEPLQPHELTACVETIHTSRWWAKVQQSASSGVLALLATYVTDVVARPWVLGSSAALHGVPLVVIGHGMRWEGVGQKLVGARRAAQLLDAIAPRSAVAFADGSDTAVVNPLVMRAAPPAETAEAAVTTATTSDSGATAAAAAAAAAATTSAGGGGGGGGAAAPLRRIAAADAPPLLLFSGECSSWPVCYRDAYKATNHSAWGACTCAPPRRPAVACRLHARSEAHPPRPYLGQPSD